MQLHGTRVLQAPRDQVWALLSEPPALRGFIPGCEGLTAQPDGGGYDAIISARVGPVAARFKGTLTLDERQPPQRYRLRFQGQGGAAGFARGEARLELSEQGDSTLLQYTVQAQVGGKLAQVGSRLIDATAGKLADEFFNRLAEQFDAPPTPALAAADAGETLVSPGLTPAPRRLYLLLVVAGVLLLAAAGWLAGRPG